jgi:NAD-dependent SIR2 family protein deacetylase
MDPATKDTLSQLDNLLAASNQSWLFGAGISLDAGIPLMGPLTERVFKRAEVAHVKVFASFRVSSVFHPWQPTPRILAG